jgi:hypothetical protein
LNKTQPNPGTNILNILVAYPYFAPDVVKFFEDIPRESFSLIVDSGAFTAWNTGKEITMDGYCKFLDSIAHLRPFHAVQLDVFGDPEASWKNFLIMKERGYDVMPVFTRGEDLTMLEKMYELTDYIMFGGVVIGRGNRNYVKWFLERNKDRDAHWLGFVDMDFIKHYRPRSVDSSSWQSAARFGNVALYKGDGMIKTVSKKKFAVRPPKSLIDLFHKNGFSEREMSILRFNESWICNGKHKGKFDPDCFEDQRSSAQMVSSIAHVRRSIEVERNIGTKIYLACGNRIQVELLYGARDFLIKRGLV